MGTGRTQGTSPRRTHLRARAAVVMATGLLAASCISVDRLEPATVAVGPGTTERVSPPPEPSPSPVSSLVALTATEVASGLDRPVFATAPRGDDRLFIVEQAGRILIVLDEHAGVQPFLDITDRVGSAALEQGLLGLAFHPDFPTDDRLFVHYTDLGGDTRVESYRLTFDPDVADAASGSVLIEYPQPASNHNGGMLQFGTDGYLYVAIGDGGGANDQFENGQSPHTLLGSILRLDVDGGAPYAIPPDNPFVGGGGDVHVWAFGLRNPWRFDIDRESGLMYVADVGQAAWEEISVVGTSAAGANFGWPIMEGATCFSDPVCRSEGLLEPVLVYDHGEGCSIIGGFVYRGERIPELEGHFLFADWCGGWVRSLLLDDGTAETRDWTGDLGTFGQILSFGRDGFGEIYILNGEGSVFRIDPIR